ncbi:MAG: serine/threonine protein kinase [Deltaproteobacteria bacterium]|nr:serine/threonine protein kinase [Deltaproteobacteria bacterium]
MKTNLGCRMLVPSVSESRPRSPAGSSLVGQVLGNYRLISELSTGGMGTVYRCQHELLGRFAAIKLLRPELCSNDVLVQRFFNEAKAATAIRHPGIIEVYDFGYTDDGRAYLVMELLEGEALATRLARRGRLTELEAATIARAIANALRAAHAQGIVHRDLKPDNIFLVPDADGSGDRVKVLDFGVAKLTDPSPTNVRHTQTGALMGTPLYMAPEQARAAGTIDHRADLYSLGCILYELLVGKTPFVAEGAGEIIALQLFGEVQRPSERLAELTPEMDSIVMRLLEKEPHDRFQSAADVQQALSSVSAQMSSRLSAELGAGESRPQLIMPTPMPSTAGTLRLGLVDERASMQQKRSALPIIAGVVTVVLAAGAGLFVMTGSSDDEPPAKKAPEAAVTPTPPPAPVPSPAPPPAPPPPKAVVVEPPKPAVVEPPKVPVITRRRDKRVEDITGPVVKPDGIRGDRPPATTGPVTRPGMRTTEGAPIEPDLGPPSKKEP